MATNPSRLNLSVHFVANNLVVLLSGTFISQALVAVTLLLIARQLGRARYGEYMACFTLITILVTLFSLGLDQWLLREGGRNPRGLGEHVGSVLLIKSILGVLWLSIINWIAPNLPQSTFPISVLRWMTIAVWLDSLFATTLTAFKSLLRNRINSLLEVFSDVAWLIVTFILVMSEAATPAIYAQARTLVVSMSLGMGILLVWRQIGLRFQWAVLKQALHASLPFAFSDFFATSLLRLDVVLVAFGLGQRAVGIYSPAVSVVTALFFVPGAIFGVMVPVLAGLFSTQSTRGWHAARYVIIGLAGVGGILTLALYSGAAMIVAGLGVDFEEALGLLHILSLLLVFKALSFAMAAILVALGYQLQRALVQFVAVIINIGLNLWLMQIWGVTGVAWVYVVTEIVVLLGYSGLVVLAR